MTSLLRVIVAPARGQALLFHILFEITCCQNLPYDAVFPRLNVCGGNTYQERRGETAEAKDVLILSWRQFVCVSRDLDGDGESHNTGV
jgi:hypothetical protein